MTSNIPHIKYIGWDKPAIDLVSRELMAICEEGPTALCDTILVVPTAESGRRLREYTAALAGKPILMPRITVPGNLLAAGNCASPMQVAAAWTQVIAESGANKRWPGLFPHTPPGGHEEDWVAAQVADLVRLDAQLEQHMVTPGQIISTLQAPAYAMVAQAETARWQQYSDLNATVARQLHKWGLTPPAEARQATLDNLCRHNIPKRVILACLPQLTNQNRHYLQRLTALGCRVEIWVNAPKDLEQRFDSYGQPRHDNTEYSWNTCAIPVPDSCIEVAAHCRDMAARIIRHMADCPAAATGDIALGTLDPACLPDMETAFANAGWRMLSPSGRTAAASAAGQLLKQLQDYADSQYGADAKPAGALLRNPLLQRLFYPQGKGTAHQFCKTLDAIEQQKFPATAKALLDMIEASCPADAEQETTRLQNEGSVEYARHIIKHVADGVRSGGDLAGVLRGLGSAIAPPQDRRDTPYGKLLGSLSNALLQYAALITGQQGSLCTAHTALNLIRSQVEQESITELTHENADIDALGWLEMIFTPGQHMFLAGLHEGCVPEAPGVDAYLPDSLRRQLGMACAAQRSARDSFVLASLAAAHGENLHILVAGEKPDGSPASPSSLLLRTDGSLVDRINLLFQHPEAPIAVPAYERGNWHAGAGCLRATPTGPVQEHISLLKQGAVSRWASGEKPFSPSCIKRFLTCPLRFWLKELLQLSPGDAYAESTGALSAMDLGTMVHDTVEHFAATYSGKDRDYTLSPPDETAMSRHIIEIFDSQLHKALGNEIAPSMKPQYETYKDKLRDFAKLHARDLRDGWVVIATEQETRWMMDGEHAFDMRIDRVDENRLTGELRIIDYKTGKTRPREAHLEEMKPDQAEMYRSRVPELALLDSGSCERWKDVQLPLYKAYMQDTHPGKAIRTGYILIPKGAEHVQFAEWEITPEEKAAMLACTRGAISLIRSGRGLYSAEELGYEARYSDFGPLAAEADLKIMLNLPEFTPDTL